MLDWIVALNLIREILEILSKLANELILPTQIMMDTDTVTETMRGSQVHGTSSPDTHHMSTAATWSQPEPWDPGPQIKNIDSIHFVSLFQIIFPHN